jgi:hypothetical protein
MKIKFRFRLFQLVAMFTVAFWILETVVFLIIYGWHWKAVSVEESICDKTVTIGSFICVFLFFWVVYDIVNIIVNYPDEKEPETNPEVINTTPEVKPEIYFTTACVYANTEDNLNALIKMGHKIVHIDFHNNFYHIISKK